MTENNSKPVSAESDRSGPSEGIERLRKLAYEDPMTGLLNRRGFDDALRRIWALAQKKAAPIGLLLIDVDHFKSVNDSYGHAVGDQVLKECAGLIQDCVRDSDIVCRYYGGDELVVILPEFGGKATRKVAEQMLETFRQQRICEATHDIQMTISIGVCNMIARPAHSADRFLILADRALYRAKQTGRDRVCYAEDTDMPLALDELESVPVVPAGMAAPQRVVLVVDDDPTLCTLFQRMLSYEKFDVLVADSSESAIALVQEECGMIDVALVDLHLGQENGLNLLKELRSMDESMIGVVITGQASVDNAVTSLRYGAYDFLQKPVSATQLIAVLERATKYRRLVLENKRYQQHLEDMVREKNAALSRALEQVSDSYQFTLEAMADMLDAREQKTGEHSKRVARMSRVLAEEIGATLPEVETIETGALLHDIGKIAIPDSILLKPEALTAEEGEIMREHPHLGYNIIKAGPGFAAASEIVLEHQERFDGKGYPRGLQGGEICLGARIFAVVDTYDAIRSGRPYSKERSAQEAMDEILKNKGTQFDPVVVEALQRCQDEIEEAGAWTNS
jgi:cyclic di-GMP phosphodiesterase